MLVAALIGEYLQAEQPATATMSAVQQVARNFSEQTHGGPRDVQALLEWVQAEQLRTDGLSEVQAHHSSLSWVLQNQQGLPIVRALLLIGIARHGGYEAHGLNHPGHFLLRVEGVIVDPMALEIVTLPAANAPAAQASPLDIALRMLNNLKHVAQRDQRWDEMLNLLDLQTALCRLPQARAHLAALAFERGEVWLQLGGIAAAKAAYTDCLEQQPGTALARQAENALKDLESRDTQWH